jgi:hypothetical protein
MTFKEIHKLAFADKVYCIDMETFFGGLISVGILRRGA